VLDECSDCKVLKEQDIEPLKWPTDVAQATSSMIRSNPDMNFILPAVDTMGIFASAGVRQAGAVGRTFVISSDGSGPGALGLVKEGDVFIADPGSATGWLGWAIVDQSMRAMLGEKPADGVVPVRVIESDTLADIDPKDEDSIYGSDYRDGFKQLWGLS
jgi:ribose transport system substrate-binding protein